MQLLHRRLYHLVIVIISVIVVVAAIAEQDNTRVSNQNDKNTPLLLTVCNVDGSVITLEAWTGQIRSMFSTGRPLVSASHPNKVVPGLDGKIYQLFPKNTNDDNDDEEDELRDLPMTMEEVVLHPVQTCQGEDGVDCGIVTGTKLTYLYALDPQTGELQWTQKQTSSSSSSSSSQSTRNDNDSDKDAHHQDRPVLLLQRQEYIARLISTRTGEEVWNVTWGHFEALEFDTRPSKTSTALARYLPGSPSSSPTTTTTTTTTHPHETNKILPTMPLIAFGDDGMTLAAMDPIRQQHILWKQHRPTVMASAYGIEGNMWVPLKVLEPKSLEDMQDEPFLLLLPPPKMMTTVHPDPFHADLLWQEVQHRSQQHYAPARDIVTYQPPNTNHVFHTSASTLNQWPMNDDRDLCANDELYPPLLLLESGRDEKWKHGMFVTYSMMAGMVSLLITTILGVRFWYVHKKHQWLLTKALSTVLSSGPIDARAELSLPNGMLLSSTTTGTTAATTTTTTTANPKTLIRSVSLPVFRGDAQLQQQQQQQQSSQLVAVSKLLGNSEPVLQSNAEEKATTTSTKSSENTYVPLDHQMNGYPLVRYSRFKSEFRELSALGKGGFGTVFRCQNSLDGREYAVKKIWIKSHTDGEFSQQLERVLREVKILALLDHPNIVRYYTAWLELENDGGGDHEVNDELLSKNSEYITTATDPKMIGCYSSELLTGMSDSRWPSTSRLAVRSTRRASIGRYGTSSSNPLGWNTFLTDFGSSHDLGSKVQKSNEWSSADGKDYGFTFERSESALSLDESNANLLSTGLLPAIHDADTGGGTTDHEDSSSGASMSDDDSDSSSSEGDDEIRDNDETLHVTRNNTRETTAAHDEVAFQKDDNPSRGRPFRHTLYIQMQLCSQKTLGDFLANPKARKGNVLATEGEAVDIPFALSLFHQISQGVKHVHEQGLIHRDLKPCNCFVDESGVVKVGDFGLSRESAATGKDDLKENGRHSLGGDENNTAGVGTRSYASPEQMKGSDYDASTDVYSLGIMLFELCYPMCTGMERQIVFSRLRQGEFPDKWHSGVAASFPTVHSLVMAMLSPRPSDRPSAETVANCLESVLGEYTVLSLDRKRHHREGSILLRVEAIAHEGILPQTIQLMKEAAPHVEIMQYGLRGQDSKAIMEFALSTGGEEASLGNILTMLRKTQDIQMVRQISDIRHHEF